jgi:hypothetical protein
MNMAENPIASLGCMGNTDETSRREGHSHRYPVMKQNAIS